eukprot:COSAG02_NODE_64415_length_260_cov_1.267081_1_plen_48_part_10
MTLENLTVAAGVSYPVSVDNKMLTVKTDTISKGMGVPTAGAPVGLGLR